MSLATVAVATIVGIATGVASSFAVWWWLTRHLRPNLMICCTLADFISTDGGTRTQFRLVNQGRRAAYDISIRAAIRMPSLIAPGVSEAALLREEYVTALGPGSSRRWGLNLARSEELEIYWKYMPKAISEQHEAGLKVRLGDVLRALPDAELHVGVFATDAFSGARRHVERSFTKEKIVSGRFIGEGCKHAETSDWLPGDPQDEREARRAR